MKNDMKPTASLYTIKVHDRQDMSSSFQLKSYSESPDRLRPCGLLGGEDGDLRLPWMTKKELVGWLRKAADRIEETIFE